MAFLSIIQDFFTICFNEILISFLILILSIFIFFISKQNKKIYFIVLFCISIISIVYSVQKSIVNFNIQKYITNSNTFSTIYEQHYVDPKQADIYSPKDKQNLIIIYLESMEDTFYNKDLIGVNLIPHLEKLKKENISFSGYSNGYAQNWTQASMLASMAGIPANYFLIDGWNPNNMAKSLKSFAPNAYSIGQILKNNDYQTLFVQGGNLTFSGTEKFLETHGFDKQNIFGKKELKKIYGYTSSRWGLFDKDVYNVFKEKLLNLAQNKKQPFFAVMFTIDTHANEKRHPSIPARFPLDSQNNIYFASYLVDDFYKWLQKQDFANNTTLILLGDHLRMNLLEDEKIDFLRKVSVLNRSIYNVFINSKKYPIYKNRKFYTFDLFPTILESIGFEIKEHRLGLGTSLFSSEKTLLEQFSETTLNLELAKRNKIYESLWK